VPVVVYTTLEAVVVCTMQVIDKQPRGAVFESIGSIIFIDLTLFRPNNSRLLHPAIMGYEIILSGKSDDPKDARQKSHQTINQLTHSHRAELSVVQPKSRPLWLSHSKKFLAS
jgi:hypothetical protein